MKSKRVWKNIGQGFHYQDTVLFFCPVLKSEGLRINFVFIFELHIIERRNEIVNKPSELIDITLCFLYQHIFWMFFIPPQASSIIPIPHKCKHQQFKWISILPEYKLPIPNKRCVVITRWKHYHILALFYLILALLHDWILHESLQWSTEFIWIG